MFTLLSGNPSQFHSSNEVQVLFQISRVFVGFVGIVSWLYRRTVYIEACVLKMYDNDHKLLLVLSEII